jgi:uncharacterized surface protein with fasciclin (FAS1) repeats
VRKGLPLIAAALLLAGCGGQSDEGNEANGSTNQAQSESQSGDQTLAALLAADPRFMGLVQAAGMTKVLEGREPYTVLAPTSEALDALPAGTLERLQQPAARSELTGLLRRHILPGTITRADIDRALQGGSGNVSLASMAGDPLSVRREGNALRIGDSTLVGEESRAKNGVVHRIDRVLAAPTPATGSGAE